LPLIYLNLRVLSTPLVKKDVDDTLVNEIEDEIINIDLENNDIKIIDIFADEESIPTENLNITDEEECLTEECYETSKRILSNLDTSVDPCDNFFQFSCGGWLSEMSKTDINYNNSKNVMNDLQKKINKNINEIFKGEYKIDTNLSKEQQEYDEKAFSKVKNAYNVCMTYDVDPNSRNENLKNFIKQLNISENKENFLDPINLTNLLINLHKIGIDTLFDVNINYINDNEPELNLTNGDNLNRFLPYLLVSYDKPEIFTVYNEYVKKVLKLYYGNEINVEPLAKSIIDLTKKINDLFELNFNLMNEYYKVPKKASITLLNEMVPIIDWNLYLKERLAMYGMEKMLTENTTLNINSYDYYLINLQKCLKEVDVDDLINYFEWTIISSNVFADAVSEDIKDVTKETKETLNILLEGSAIIFDDDIEYIDAFENLSIDKEKMKKEFTDIIKKRKVEEPKMEVNKKEKYDICIDKIEKLMPNSISKYFIQNAFSDTIKLEAGQMIGYIKKAMLERIPKMEWLDEETKQYAMMKVEKMKSRIGYSDDIMD
ncbi:hypothetical protein PIROE2DRAFT_19063, partial [Piromyces sp. E2]